jgi:hypothetical protein
VIARTLLIPDSAGRPILIWTAQGAYQGAYRPARAMAATLKAWSADHEKIYATLDKDYGKKKGERKGDVIEVARDICSFRQTESGE